MFKEELASKHGPVWMRKNPEKEIKEIGWLLENVKAKIKIFELNPIENKDIFDKFRLSDELNDVIALSSSPKGHVGIENNVPLTVIISNGYIKEYWLGCDNCKSGLINFNVDKIGSMEVPTLRAKMIESSGFMLFVIFMGFIYIMTTKCADYFGDALNIPSLLLFILGLPILIMIVLSIKRVKMPPLYYTDHVLEKRDETKTNTS